MTSVYRVDTASALTVALHCKFQMLSSNDSEEGVFGFSIRVSAGSSI